MSELEKHVTNLEAEMRAVKSLIQKVLNPDGKIDLNLSIEELEVRIQGKTHVERSLDAGTLPGRIVFCALKDFPKDKVWSQSEMLRVMQERGWNVNSGSLSTTVNRMVSEGLLISKEREGYRLPSKVTFTGEEL